MSSRSLSIVTALSIVAGFLLVYFWPPAIAHAEPAATATATTISEWSLVVIGILGGLGTLLGGVSMILHAVAPKTSTKWDDSLRGHLDEVRDLIAELTSVVRSVGGRSTSAITAPAVPPKPPAGSGAATMLAVLLLGGFAMSQASCATVGPKLGAGLSAALDCELPELQPLIAELLPTAKDAVVSWISADGKSVDTSKLKAAAHALKTAQGRCALSTAVAVLTAPQPTVAGAPQAAGLEVDAGAMRAVFASVKQDWGVAAVRAVGGEVL